MATIYTHNGDFGAEAFGTREWFMAAMAPSWAEWHRDATERAAAYEAGDHSEKPPAGVTPEMSLDAYIEHCLDRSLVELSDDEAAAFRLLETGEAVPQ